MSWDIHRSSEETKSYLKLWQEYYNDPSELYWGIFLSGSGILIETVYLCPENKNADLGFISHCLGSKF